jgi:hypothetical protein
MHIQELSAYYVLEVAARPLIRHAPQFPELVPNYRLAQVVVNRPVWLLNPVYWSDDGVIVAGHGRVLAAPKLGLADVPGVRARPTPT